MLSAYLWIWSIFGDFGLVSVVLGGYLYVFLFACLSRLFLCCLFWFDISGWCDLFWVLLSVPFVSCICVLVRRGFGVWVLLIFLTRDLGILVVFGCFGGFWLFGASVYFGWFCCVLLCCFILGFGVFGYFGFGYFRGICISWLFRLFIVDYLWFGVSGLLPVASVCFVLGF